MVYRYRQIRGGLKDHVHAPRSKDPEVVVTLVRKREVPTRRIYQFLADMLKVGRQAADAHLVLTGLADSSERTELPWPAP